MKNCQPKNHQTSTIYNGYDRVPFFNAFKGELFLFLTSSNVKAEEEAMNTELKK